jgi:16S rRNA (guanine966-N2)-methyltransferase
VLIEQDRQLVDLMQAQIQQLGAAGIVVEQGDALTWLQTAAQDFDIIFLDPPFGQGLLQKSCDLILKLEKLRSGGLIYIESEPGIDPPLSWKIKKQTAAGQVQCMLLTLEQKD